MEHTYQNFFMAKVDIKYHHLPELGISSELRRDLNGEESYKELFEHYASTILPARSQALDEIKKLLLEYRRVALTCFEADYHLCHRHKIAELFELDPELDIPVDHI